MEQVRIRNREREERLRVRATILERVRQLTQKTSDTKKLQDEGFAKAMSNMTLNTYRDVEVLKYVSSGVPDLYKLIALIGVYRRQQKRGSLIRSRSEKKLKREKFKLVKKKHKPMHSTCYFS